MQSKMSISLLGQRIRGDWLGIFTCSFIICCWTFALYSSVFTIIFPHTSKQSFLLPVYVGIALLTIISMLQAIVTNPGKLLDISNAEILGWYYCEKCQRYRPPRSHHCSRCSQCVRKMDHHCPWINNCIGEDNCKHFTRFVFYAAIMSWFSLTLCVSYFMNWLSICTSCQQDSDIKIEVGCLTFISLTFAIFTSFMFVDQIIKIISNVTALELMKDKSLIRRSLNNPRKASWYTLLSRTFGSSNFITWFLPFISTPIRPSYEYDTYSYEDCV